MKHLWAAVLAVSALAQEPCELAEAEARRRELVAVFDAVGSWNTPWLAALLNGGADPNAVFPTPGEPGFVERFEDRNLRYYLASEAGFTPLMLAAATGNLPAVRMLLAAGAEPHRKTRRHRTFALWLAGKHGHIEIMRALMGIGPEHEARRLHLHVSLAEQRVRLHRGSELLLESPISSGRSSHPTPVGTYIVTDKYRDWRSTLYNARMPWFLRLSCSDFGLHAGNLPGRPASHGCIRLPPAKAKELFAMVPPGVEVEIR
jgi:hypothetical protein